MSAWEPRKLGGYAIVAVLVAILTIQYVNALGPSARRERSTACKALEPTAFNAALGKIPQASGKEPVAPDLEALDFEGKPRRLAAYRGNVVFLNFWATWCPPCVKEMPSLEKLQRELGDEGLVVLTVSSDKSWDDVRKFFPNGTNLSVLLDPPAGDSNIGKQAHRYGTEKLPETYVIDKKGVIRYYFVNERDWSTDTALECMRSLLEE